MLNKLNFNFLPHGGINQKNNKMGQKLKFNFLGGIKNV